MGRVRRTLGHTVIYIIGLVVNRGAAFALIPMYTRTLSETQVGVWELATTTTLFLYPFLDLSMSAALGRFYHAYDNEKERRKVFNSSLLFVSALLVVTVSVVYYFADPLAGLAFGGRQYAELLKSVAVLAALTALGNQPLAWLRTQERSVAFASLNLVRGLIGPATICLLVLKYHLGVKGIIWGDATGLTAMTLAGLWLCRRWLRFEIATTFLKPMLAFALPLLPMCAAAPILTVSDRYFVNSLGGKETLAVLAIGAKVGVLIQLFTQALQTAYPPAAFQLAKQNDSGRVFAVLLRVIALGLCTISLLLIAAGPELVHILAPNAAYASAYRIVPFITFSYVMGAVALNVMTGMAILKRTFPVSVVVCIAAAFKLLLNVALIRRYGIMGAAFATFAAYALELTLAYRVTQRAYPIPYELRAFGLLCLLTLAATVGIQYAVPLTLWLSLSVRGAIILGFSLISLRLFVTASERAQALELIGHQWRRWTSPSVRPA